jgi:hypothetical protein
MGVAGAFTFRKKRIAQQSEPSLCAGPRDTPFGRQESDRARREACKLSIGHTGKTGGLICSFCRHALSTAIVERLEVVSPSRP